MLGYLILGTTATRVHSLARLVDVPNTYPRTPLYVPAARMQTREPVGSAADVNEPQSLRGTMVYEGGSLGVTTYDPEVNLPG